MKKKNKEIKRSKGWRVRVKILIPRVAPRTPWNSESCPEPFHSESVFIVFGVAPRLLIVDV